MNSPQPLTPPPDGSAHAHDIARPMPRRIEAVAPLNPAAAMAHAEGRSGQRLADARSWSSSFAPLLIFFAAWLAWAVFQAVQLHEENKSLQSLKASQEQQVQQAQRVRQTLDALASETKRLADAGNPNARLVIEELARRGITVNPAAATASPAK